MSEQENRSRVVDAMCMTWRHDFGLDKREHALGSCGMTDEERDALRRQMGTDCIGIPGRYSWTLAGDVLIATAIDDPCASRRQGTSGVRWTRMR